MRIAIDLRALQIGHQYRGIGAYITNVVGRFPINKTTEFIIVRYDDSNPVKDFNLPFEKYEEVIIPRPVAAHGLRKLFQIAHRRIRPNFGNLQSYEPDVFFQPDFSLGLPRGGDIKRYVVVYDLIPLALKDIYLPSWKQHLKKYAISQNFILLMPLLLFPPYWLRLFSKASICSKLHKLRILLSARLKESNYINSLRTVKRSDAIISISEATSKDINKFLDIPKSKIKTIYLAPSVPQTDTSAPREPKQANRITNPFLLYIGGVDERRKVDDLIHAFNQLNGRGYAFDLVLCGKELAKAEKVPNIVARETILNSSYKDQIHLLGFTSEEEKSWLFQHAFTFVYPTLYEGFGLPVLEAMGQGCPTITYNNSSLPEVVGSASVLLDEQNHIAIRDAIISLQKNPERKKELIRAGKKRAAKFSWDKCAKETYEYISE